MKAIWYLTWRQLCRDKSQTLLALVCVWVCQLLLAAAVLGGASMEAAIAPKDTQYYTPFVRAAAGMLAVLLAIASALLVHSVLDASAARRVRMLGQLASVGATRRQLRASVFLEALLLGAAAIPLAILCAMAGLAAAFGLMQGLELFRGQPLRLVVSPQALGLCAACGFVSLALACIGPAKRAFRLSPLEALREGGMAGSVRRAGRWKAGRSPVAQLAARSLRRPGMRGSIITIAVCVMLTVCGTVFARAVQHSYLEYGEFPFSYRVYLWAREGWPDEELQKIRQSIDAPSITAELFNYYSTTGVRTMFQLAVLEDDDFAAWYGAPLPGEAGEELRCVVSTADSSPDTTPAAESGLRVLGSTPLTESATCDVPLPMHLGRQLAYEAALWQGNGRMLVTCRSELERLIPSTGPGTVRSIAVYVDTQDGAAITEQLYRPEGVEYTVQDYTPTSEAVVRREFIRQFLHIFLTGFLALVWVVCAASVLNVTGAQMRSRRQELALLRSAGMTVRQLRRMLWRECALCGAAGLPIGAAAGLLAEWPIAVVLNQRMGEMLPLWGLVLTAAGVAAVLALAGRVCRQHLAELDLARLLRQE